MKQKINDLVKRAGFKNLGEVAFYSEVTTQTLRNLYARNPVKFKATLFGAAINKMNAALEGVADLFDKGE